MAKKIKKPVSEKKGPTFEESIESLEGIVRDLEEGRMGLTDSLEKYEKGVRHLKHCYQILDAAEKRVKLLSGITQSGDEVTEEFDDDETRMQQAAPQTRRVKRKKVRKSVASQPEAFDSDKPGDDDEADDDVSDGDIDVDDMDDGGTLF